MLRRRLLQRTLQGSLGAVLPAVASAQTFPSKPIRVFIPVPPGGTMDVLTRAIANQVKDSLGIVILEHKSGANGNIAMEAGKVAEPDGHTLVLGTASMLAMNPYAYKEVRFDVQKDFEPIVLAARFETALCVHPSVPVANFKELLAWFKANPGKASIASYGAGTPSHFVIEMLAEATGIKITHVPYRGATQGLQDLLGGQIQFFVNTVGQSLAGYHAKRFNIIASSGTTRSPFLPDVPTFVELGYPKVSATGWFSYIAPKGTPKAVLERLNGAINKALQDREVRAQLLTNGMYPVGGTRQELAQTIKEDAAHWQRVIKQTGFVAN